MSKTIIPAYETSDGAGVKIFRSLGQDGERRAGDSGEENIE